MTWHILMEIDRDSGDSLSRQIQESIRSRINEGVLHPGAHLPSTRQLALDLGISRSVAVDAYEQLAAEGYLLCRQGSGTRVAGVPTADGRTVAQTANQAGNQTVNQSNAHAVAQAVPKTVTRTVTRTGAQIVGEAESRSPAAWDLRAGRADVTNFPRAEWLACYRTVLAAAGREELDYPPVAGLAALRESLASYLGRVRGVRVATDMVMVTAGFAQGLSLLCESLPRLGIHRLAVEDPGHSGQRGYIRDCGIRVVPVRVDEDGIDVADLAASGARAVLVTPAHQFPTGATMSPGRRAELIGWAEEVDGLIIEDDYDGEFWFERASRPSALQGAAPDRVVYAGTASKALVAGLRLGWLVIPPQLSALLGRIRARRDLGSDGLTQRAFAELIDSGLLDRHLRRVRPRYRARREALADAVARYLPSGRLTGSSAGLHAYLQLSSDLDEAAVVAAALDRSVLVRGGRHYQVDPGGRPPALIVGYSTLPVAGIADSIRAIAAAVHEQRSARSGVGAGVGAGAGLLWREAEAARGPFPALNTGHMAEI
jgi:GntR family transcriptional regulator/MocR family aminotransferase